MSDFSHLSKDGKANMVDVGDKSETRREALVTGEVVFSRRPESTLDEKMIAEIATVARVAGIQAAKQTWQLIPMCHQLNLSKVEVNIEWSDNGVFAIGCRARCTSNTGVEMEAFTGAQIAALTVYDMIKAVYPEAVIGNFKLIEKTGGKTGQWKRDNL